MQHDDLRQALLDQLIVTPERSKQNVYVESISELS
eukprot:gene6689-6182_t